ncbi:MAG TPA: sensor histidine kinase [Thermoguttaceae bacterium]|nr:sensor histidine kinase [Thermoguttaceae bacterium]
MSSHSSGIRTSLCDRSEPDSACPAGVRFLSEEAATVVDSRNHRRSDADRSASREQDRVLLACDLHDGMLQHVIGAQMRLQSLLNADTTMAEPVRREIALSLNLIEKSICEARHLVRGLRPPGLEESDIVSALQELIRELPAGGPRVDLETEGPFDGLDDVLEDCLFRMVQESLANARRHSRSDQILVRLAANGDVVRLQIRDWGTGFDTSQASAGNFGLQGMQERARLLGGRITIKSDPGKGTQVFVELPIVRAPGQAAQVSKRSYE